MRNRIGPLAGSIAAALALAALAGACSKTTQESVTVSPAAFVAESAHATLAQKTADLTLAGTVNVAGRTVPVAGTGLADFGSQLMSMDATAKASGMGVEIKELLVSGKLYMNIKAGGHSLSELTGKPWISLPLPTSADSLYNSDPFAQLKLLEQQGATVTPLGHKTLDGRTVSGFSIVPSKASMLKGAESELSNMGFDQSQVSQIENGIQSSAPPTITVWFDNSRLLRQTAMTMNLGTGASAGSFTLQMNFDHYAVPVHIKAPSPSDTVSFKQFLQDVQQAGSSGS